MNMKRLDPDKTLLFHLWIQPGTKMYDVCAFMHLSPPAVFQRKGAPAVNHPWIQMSSLLWCGQGVVTRLSRELTRHIMSDPYQPSKSHTGLNERPTRRHTHNPLCVHIPFSLTHTHWEHTMNLTDAYRNTNKIMSVTVGSYKSSIKAPHSGE